MSGRLRRTVIIIWEASASEGAKGKICNYCKNFGHLVNAGSNNFI